MEDVEIMNWLSEPIRDDIYAHLYGVVIEKSEIFLQFDSTVILQITKLIRIVIFAPDDVLFEEGEMSASLYFIQKGTVDIYHEKSQSSYAELVPGEHFGEFAFFTEKPRSASARCLDFVELDELNFNDFNVMILQRFPDALQTYNNIKDDIILKGDYSSINARCYICAQKGHVVKNCDKMIIGYKNPQLIKPQIPRTVMLRNTKTSKDLFANKQKRNKKKFNKVVVQHDPPPVSITYFTKNQYFDRFPIVQQLERSQTGTMQEDDLSFRKKVQEKQQLYLQQRSLFEIDRNTKNIDATKSLNKLLSHSTYKRIPSLDLQSMYTKKNTDTSLPKKQWLSQNKSQSFYNNLNPILTQKQNPKNWVDAISSENTVAFKPPSKFHFLDENFRSARLHNRKKWRKLVSLTAQQLQEKEHQESFNASFESFGKRTSIWKNPQKFKEDQTSHETEADIESSGTYSDENEEQRLRKRWEQQRSNSDYNNNLINQLRQISPKLSQLVQSSKQSDSSDDTIEKEIKEIYGSQQSFINDGANNNSGKTASQEMSTSDSKMKNKNF